MAWEHRLQNALAGAASGAGTGASIGTFVGQPHWGLGIGLLAGLFSDTEMSELVRKPNLPFGFHYNNKRS